MIETLTTLLPVGFKVDHKSTDGKEEFKISDDRNVDTAINALIERMRKEKKILVYAQSSMSSGKYVMEMKFIPFEGC